MKLVMHVMLSQSLLLTALLAAGVGFLIYAVREVIVSAPNVSRSREIAVRFNFPYVWQLFDKWQADKNCKKAETLGTELSFRRKERVSDVVDNDVKAEALASLNLAIEMKLQEKPDKAMKLFQHAVNLDPSHADILNAYGEFIEEHIKDVVKAEQFYYKALAESPSHSKALENRRRTLPLVEEIDNENFKRIDKKRARLIQVPESDAALRRAKHESYFQHIYHTNAIEGNTLTLHETRAIVETRIAVGGKSILEHNEVLGVDSAMSFINSTLTQRIGKITVQDILDIHRRVLGHVDPVVAGTIRDTQVWVGEFQPPSPTAVMDELRDLVDWLNAEDTQTLHPIEFAALAHYRLVYIHPFLDGNGRTSRLLMNLILMQAGFPPVIIRVEDRLAYYETLRTANSGDVRPFIRFIAMCTERTLNWFLYATTPIQNNTELSELDITDTLNLKKKSRVIVLENEERKES